MLMTVRYQIDISMSMQNGVFKWTLFNCTFHTKSDLLGENSINNID